MFAETREALRFHGLLSIVKYFFFFFIYIRLSFVLFIYDCEIVWQVVERKNNERKKKRKSEKNY